MNPGIAADKALLADNVARRRNKHALERREKFAIRHPEVHIRAKREDGGPLAFYVTTDEYAICWLDASAMMDDLEAECDAPSEDGKSDD